jgi:hypothetical protein
MSVSLGSCCLYLACAVTLACGNSEPSKQDPPSPKPFVGPFKTLRGFAGDELPPGDGSTPIIALSSGEAMWWIGDSPATATLIDVGRAEGARWLDSKHLRIGLGTLDLDSRTFAVEPALQPFVKDENRLAGAAWFPNGARVALLFDPPPFRFDQPAPRGYDRSKRELVIVTLGSTAAPIRRAVTIEGEPHIAASNDSVLVAAIQTMLFDVSGEPLAWPADLPAMTSRVSFSEDMFVLVGGNGTITLLDPRSAATIATWSTPAADDAIAFAHGVGAVALDGTVRLGCMSGRTITQAIEIHVGKVASRIQVLGNRLVVSADGPEPIRVAELNTPCH